MIELQYTNRTENENGVRVSVDDEEVIALAEKDSWGDSSGTSYSAGSTHQQQDFPLDEPLQLLRLKFMVDQGDGSSTAPDGPGDGILLWIEKSP